MQTPVTATWLKFFDDALHCSPGRQGASALKLQARGDDGVPSLAAIEIYSPEVHSPGVPVVAPPAGVTGAADGPGSTIQLEIDEKDYLGGRNTRSTLGNVKTAWVRTVGAAAAGTLRWSVNMVALLLCFLLLAGCSSPEEFVRVQTTPEMRRDLRTPPELTLPAFKAAQVELQDKAEAKAEQVAADAVTVQRTIRRAVVTEQRGFQSRLRALTEETEAELFRLAAESEDRGLAAQSELSRHQADAARSRERMDALAAAGQAKADAVRSLLSGVLDMVGAAAPAVNGVAPGLGLALTGAIGLAGLYIRKPGTSKEIADAAASARAEERAKADADRARLAAELASLQQQIRREADAAYDQGRNETLGTVHTTRAASAAAGGVS